MYCTLHIVMNKIKVSFIVSEVSHVMSDKREPESKLALG